MYSRSPDLSPQDTLRVNRHTKQIDLYDVFRVALVYRTAATKALGAFKVQSGNDLPGGMCYVAWVLRDKPRTTRKHITATPLAALNALREFTAPRVQRKQAFTRVERFLEALVRGQSNLEGELDAGNPLHSDNEGQDQ